MVQLIGRSGGQVDGRVVGFGTIGGEEAVFVTVHPFEFHGCMVDEGLLGSLQGKWRRLVLVGARSRGRFDGRLWIFRQIGGVNRLEEGQLVFLMY